MRTAGLSSGTAWIDASDIRLKDIDGDYEHGLDEIKKLHTVRFHYTQSNPLQLPFDHAMTGFVAQEVQEVNPDAIKKSADGYLELNVDPIHWATVNAVKELASENEHLKQRADNADLRADKAEFQTTKAAEKANLAADRADRAEAEIKELKCLICANTPKYSSCVP